MYLLDTDTVTNPFKKRPSPSLMTRLAPLSRAEQFVSSVSVGEIVYGAHLGPHTARHLHNLEQVILPRIQVISFDEDAARCFGQLRAQLQLAGQPIEILDLMIAATALTRNLTLVTGNVRHFGRISGLRIENWLVE